MQLERCQQRCATLFLDKAEVELQNRQMAAILSDVRKTCASLPSRLAASIDRLLDGDADAVPRRTISAPAVMESPPTPRWLGSLGVDFDAALAEWDLHDGGRSETSAQQPASTDLEMEFLAMAFTHDSAGRRALLGTAFSQWGALIQDARLGRMEAELMAKHRETMRMDARLGKMEAAQLTRCRAARLAKEHDIGMRSEIAMAAAFAVWAAYRDTCAGQRLIGGTGGA